jgi:hypothetical protein
VADLTIQKHAIGGLVPTYAAASAGGDAFLNDGRTIFHAKNGHTAAITITINAVSKCNHGFDHDVVLSVAAGDTAQFGPLPVSRFNDPATGKVTVTYSIVTALTVAATQLANN